MREIKFRAWIHDAPHKMDNMFYQENQYLASFIRRIHMYYGVKDHASYLPFQLEERLMQYTGLKDKYGKEIYDGDVLSRHYPAIEKMPEDLLAMVPDGSVIPNSWVHGAKEYRTNLTVSIPLIYQLDVDTEEYEVIGNIYEHPEILQQGQ